MLIKNAWIYHPDRHFRLGWLEVEGERIAAIGEGTPGLASGPAVDAEEMWLVPGFVDIHVHGYGGWDMNSADPEDTHRMAALLAEHGVTSWLPTVAADEEEVTLQGLRSVARAIKQGVEAAEPVGIHLEGPFLNPLRKGAFRPEVLRRPSMQDLERYFDESDGLIRRLTIAPELPGALDLVRYCRSRGAVPIMGHSDATYEQALEGIQAGIGGVTHCYNGIRPINHREPGAMVAAFLNGVIAEMIMDGIHVHPAAIKMAYRMLGPDAIAFITDSVSVAGLPDGEHPMLGDTVVVRGHEIRTLEGNLAGSALTMDRGVRNAMRFLDLSLEQVLPMATSTPLVGSGAEHRKGSLAPGRDADLVLLDREAGVVRTMVRGRWVYERKGDQRDS